NIINMVVESGGIEYAYEVSRKYAYLAQQQLLLLPDKPEKQILSDIADFILIRNF
ncbi:MAG TPA: heptaprenyl diphosphate synthase, partial [Syntrophomonas sp.]|nr:heptaprenyl diphosphate synthase [Syntrophomonas sp.]